MSKQRLRQRVAALERALHPPSLYVLEIQMWQGGLQGDGVGSIYWLMRPTPNGKGKYIKTLTAEEAAARGH